MKLPIKIILASSSPYRQALLSRLGLDFTIEAPDLDESPLTNESATELVLRLSCQKAEIIGKKYADVLVIGSDQVACLDQQILTKPGNRENARRQLEAMCGQTITFFTGLCLLKTSDQQCQSAVVPFNVSFREFGTDEIRRYLDREMPYDCAGSFKSEQMGITLVSQMQGEDPTALVGLPLIKLSEMLRHLGLSLP
jgi:septum formation protein